jgi:hypothetical protein
VSDALPAELAAATRAIERVEKGADSYWLEEAHLAVLWVASRGGDFTSDDVWAELSKGRSVPREPRALGAVMRALRRDGLIVPTDRYRSSSRATCHARPLRIWVSGRR